MTFCGKSCSRWAKSKMINKSGCAAASTVRASGPGTRRPVKEVSPKERKIMRFRSIVTPCVSERSRLWR
jgi:hypothetical protein